MLQKILPLHSRQMHHWSMMSCRWGHTTNGWKWWWCTYLAGSKVWHYRLCKVIQDDEARILAEQLEALISGIVLGGSPRTPPAASGVQHLEASSMAFMEISEDENRAAVGEDAAGGSTIPNEVQVVNNDTAAVDNTEAPPPTEIWLDILLYY